jgi:hypothetical protein
MRSSPIQLMETTLQKLYVEPVEDDQFADRSTSALSFSQTKFQTSKNCQRIDDYWNGGTPPHPGVENRTYLVSLGVRTSPDEEHVGPYRFEIVFSAVVVVVPEMEIDRANALAYQYGLTLLYGVIREQMSALSARMQWGHVMLQTMSFMDESWPVEEPEDSEPKKLLPI